MASIIRIKRSAVSGNPGTLAAGELAYSALADNGSNGGDRLYVGMGTETNGNAANHVVIGGKYFTDKLDHTPGTLTASSAIIVDSNSKIDQLNVDNLTLNGNTISSTNTDGNIVLTPDGDGYVQISGTNAIIIPKGTSAQAAPALTGAMRFNTDNTAFEGYDGTNWASLGGVKSVDGKTYIKAEATPGAADNTLYFYANNTDVAELTTTALTLKQTTASTDTTTGALVVAGGVGIAGDLHVGGAIHVTGGNLSSDSYLAAQGAPSGDGTTGFSFQNETDYDTGMFSIGDGNLQFYTNSFLALEIDGTNEAVLYTPTLQFKNDSLSATLAWDPTGDAGAVKFYTRYNNQQTISPVNDGDYLLLQTTNTSTDSTAGRSSLRWHDYNVSAYSQVDAQYDGVWIKNAAWNGSSVAQYWHFDNTGKLTLPDANNAGSQYNAYTQIWGEANNTFVIQPNADANDATLRIGNWDNSSAINIWNASSNGITIGNYDNSDSVIDIGGPNGSWYGSADDISIYAKRDGKVTLRTNNNDIELRNDSGTVTFRNADGHLVVPNTIETGDTTGDVTLAASDGTERNMVFKGDGRLSLPNNGIDFFDSNNINGSRVAEFLFDGSDLYINNFNGSFSIWANDNYNWSFNTDGSTSFPNYTFPAGQASSGQVLVDTAGNGTLAWTDGKVTIGTTDVALAGSTTTLAGLTDVTVANLNLATDTIAYTGDATDGNVVIEPKGAGYISASNAQIKNVAEPTDDTDAATKYYVDAARSGLDVKQSVRLATTEDITLSGEQIIDTKMAVAGDRVLVKNQTLAKNNGIYVVVAGAAWTRATDFDAPQEISSGAFTFVEDGDVNLNAGFVVTTKGAIVIGTTAIDWTLFSTSGTLIAGDGLSKSGYTLQVNVDASGGIEINSDALRLKSSLAGDGLTYDTGVLTVGGTTDRITVSTHSIDIASTYVGQTSITTLGTITSGTWNGNTIGSGYGGTGFSTYAKGDLIVASATDTLSKLTVGDAGQVLQVSASGTPVWGSIDGGTY